MRLPALSLLVLPCPVVFGMNSAPLTEPALTLRRDIVFFENFEDRNWQGRWDEAGHADNCELVGPPHVLPQLGRRCLRIKVGANDHYGASLSILGRNMKGGEPEELYFRYYLKFDPDWECQGGKMPGFGGTYGRAGWGLRPVHGDDGWSARGLFGRLKADSVPIGYYCYHADMTGTAGSHWEWTGGGLLKKGAWYCVECHCKMNTPGKHDGVLHGWVNGKAVFEKTDIRFRDVPSLKIEKIWFNIYNGGKWTFERDCHLYIDNVVIARSYIGPFVSIQGLKEKLRPKKDVEPGNAAEPEADRDEAVRSALEKVRSLAGKDPGAAKEYLAGLEPASEEDATAFAVMKHGLEAGPFLSQYILDAVRNGAREKIFIDMVGMKVRASIEGVRDGSLLVSAAGASMPLPLESLDPETLFSLALKVAGEEPPGAALRHIACYGLVHNLEPEKVRGVAFWIPSVAGLAAARGALIRLLSL